MPDALAEAEALAARCKAAFKKYDTNGNGTIERDELTGALEDLGLLKGVDKPSIGSFVIDMFAKLDTDGNQHLSYKEFAELYNSVVREKMIMNAGSSHGKGSDLHAVFIRFANFGKKLAKPAEDMDGKNWAKFCKDCGVVDKKRFNPTSVDMVFAKVKTKGQRTISYQEFCRALTLAAEQLGCDYESLVANVTSSDGPSTSGATVADSVAFHDDKSMYTGMHKGK